MNLVIKVKKQQMEATQKFATALTIIKTSIKRKINPYNAVKGIFDKKVIFN